VPDGARLLRPAGEALHPERYPTKELRKIRNTTPPVQWNALYQQNPVPESGEYFTSDMFRTYQGLPGHAEEYTYFMAWDLAIGEKTQNDWSVGIVGALAANGNIYILDMIRDRMGTFQIVSSMLGMAKKYPGLQVLGVEDGQIKKTMWPLLQEAMRKENVSFSIDDNLKPVTDKLMRARPLQSKMQLGQVLVPTGQPWVNRMQHEMLRFPNGQHDDIVDAMAWLIRMSQRLSAPQPKGMMKKKKHKSWKEDLASFTNDRGNSFMTA
jgi:predicted phage terminase large subunit-like protein